MGLVWSWEEGGLKGWKEDGESLHCILDWSFPWDPSLEKKCLFEESIEASCTLILVMENDWCILMCLGGVGFT